MGAHMLVEAGHTVYVEQGATEGSGVPVEDYMEAGAFVVDTAAEVFEASDMIVKVKEPQPHEFSMIKENQIIFTFFHFAADDKLTNAFIDTGAIAIAFETVEGRDGLLPILAPMSEIAGRMSIQEGAKYLEAPQGGRGVLLGGLPGVASADVVIIGAGVCGLQRRFDRCRHGCFRAPARYRRRPVATSRTHASGERVHPHVESI